MANEPLKHRPAGLSWGTPGPVAEMFMANEPLKHDPRSCIQLCGDVAEMFMANEPLKPGEGRHLGIGGPAQLVAEMFMANEPLKHSTVLRQSRRGAELQRCLWRMSH